MVSISSLMAPSQSHITLSSSVSPDILLDGEKIRSSRRVMSFARLSTQRRVSDKLGVIAKSRSQTDATSNSSFAWSDSSLLGIGVRKLILCCKDSMDRKIVSETHCRGMYVLVVILASARDLAAAFKLRRSCCLRPVGLSVTCWYVRMTCRKDWHAPSLTRSVVIGCTVALDDAGYGTIDSPPRMTLTSLEGERYCD